MMSDRLLPCRVLLVWSLIVALILPVPLGGCVARKQDGVGFVSGASSGRAASASRADVAAVGPEKDADRERPRGLDAALFNVAATFMGLPGLAPSSGARDEGLGYHQDGTARRAGSADAFDGRQARAYMGAGLMGDGAFSSPDGTLLPRRLGDEYSGRRRDYASRGFENFNLMDMALDRGLNYGMGMLNSAGEAALSGLVGNGRARLNFQLDRDGRFSGEGDVLLPFRDAPQHTLFTQIGARSMDVSGGEEDGSQRWIGNFGLGHRWFPFAESMEEAGNLMLGWNVFFDNDFSRSHQRGGAGVEARYDWFHLAANYYTPLSGWKNSRDFDGDFVEERPARGWDARAKAYLPFYRNVALTGSFSQWYGDNVAMYGSSDDLEKDPRVWSYGVEYTPIPLLSAFARQRSTERGKPDTEFGLQFTWHFDMPWEEQTSHAKVAELRTVSGSRHEFVDRENRIILEYRAKNAGRIEYLGPVSGQTNAFAFRVTDGLGRAWAGKTVWVRADNVTLAVAPRPSRSLLALAGDVLGGLFGAREAHAATASHSYVTDSQGCFTVRVTSPVAGPVTLHVRAGENEQSFTVNVVANGTLKMNVLSAALTQGTTQRVTFTFTRNGVAQSGLEVRFAANAAFRELAQGPVNAQTDDQGKVTLDLTPIKGGTATITATVGTDTVTVDLSVSKVTFVLTTSGDTAFDKNKQTITLTAELTDANGTKITLNDGDVKWSVISSKVTSEAWMRSAGAYNGLTWGQTPLSLIYGTATEIDTKTPAGTAPTGAEAYLTDIVGERKVTVKASVEYNGQTYEAAETVTFGEGPLAVFQKPLSNMSWKEAVKKCGGYYPPSQTGYQPATNLPRKEELQAVSGPGYGGYGAAFAAKWPDDRASDGWFRYWTGELRGSVSAGVVFLRDGLFDTPFQDVVEPVAVCRRGG
ncbi:inverse autotransporter beta domain-containing protein [uncultured Desulfovibrio sp.]|uniref:inverse autotransporter beta domain-containing protein n=1 Tax=uncultured Desulfovibrio sp. TaxID=167968 RepID=UPI002620D8E8|nr:inverse autotransporter beta domain-containing protein [uncultured Desulfovibrio sp.]